MKTGLQNLKILISTIFQNGGEATRSLEIAKIIRETRPQNMDLQMIFLSHGGSFDKTAKKEGFEIVNIEPKTKFANFHDDFQTRFGELIGKEEIALDYLQNEIKAYQQLKPDALIHGFYPIASIAKRMVLPNTPSIAFLPLPLNEAFLNEIHSFPDELIAARLPKAVQKLIIQALPQKIKLNNPALRHRIIAKAALKLGWNKKEPLRNTFDMLRSDLYLINDFPFFYKTEGYPEHFKFTGPLFSKTISYPNTDPKILEWLKSSHQKRIFCTLGTSGNKEHLVEVIKVFNEGVGLNWKAIILSPPAICDIHEARKLSKSDNVYITDKFINATEINAQADMVICHGGQGTLQTAITSGTPLVGLATQPEQQINLEHLSHFGMARRIPNWKWSANTIRQNVKEVLEHPQFKRRAEELKHLSCQINTQQIIADEVWTFLNGE